MQGMHLLLDFGNTDVKAAVYSADIPLQLRRYSYKTPPDFSTVMDPSAVKRIGISSVKTIPNAWMKKLLSLNKPIVEINSSIPLPFNVGYKSPLTLGNDRLCNVAAAHSMHPGQNVLVVDLGTCNTFDCIDQNGTYLGGSISPGYTMRLRAMKHFTDKLPQVSAQKPKDLIGENTQESMLSGAWFGMLGEIKSIIAQYHERFDALIVIATGGALTAFAEELKSGIFADPNLTLKGLHAIVDFQDV